jgi:cephalosporin-C deacetylase
MTEYAPYVPEDFDEFWRETAAEATAVPLLFRRSLANDFDLPGFIVETFEFMGMGGRLLNGWMAYQEGARRLPAFVWIPPYGRESLLPNEYGTREGFVSLSFNFFGNGAFHQEKYAPGAGYFAEGAGDPQTWIFRRMFQDAAIATKVLQAQVEVDENRIGAMGMSQGGGMSIWLGAWSPIIRSVCADMPFLAGMNRILEGKVYRYPLKELTDFAENVPVGLAQVQNTVSYFDTINHATRCSKPTQVSLGLKDPAVKPEAARAVFDALPGSKIQRTYDWGHDWHPSMIDANRDWLSENLRTING